MVRRHAVARNGTSNYVITASAYSNAPLFPIVVLQDTAETIIKIWNASTAAYVEADFNFIAISHQLVGIRHSGTASKFGRPGSTSG